MSIQHIFRRYRGHSLRHFLGRKDGNCLSEIEKKNGKQLPTKKRRCLMRRGGAPRRGPSKGEVSEKKAQPSQPSRPSGSRPPAQAAARSAATGTESEGPSLLHGAWLRHPPAGLGNAGREGLTFPWTSGGRI